VAHDLVIRGGTVIDGTGAPGYRADVGIEAGKIVEIGTISGSGSVANVDAEGLVVTPGFVDAHTHMDAQVMWDQLGTSSCWHGVTTVVMGNCGFTLAPVRHGEEDLVVGNLERAEDISATALAAGVDWSWQSFPEYMDAVDRQPKAINYAAQVGHSSLRTWAMGQRAFEGPADEDEIAEMEAQLRMALQAGAYGFTTSRSPNHQTPASQPVASRLADWTEVERLVRVMGQVNKGVFELAQEPASFSPDPVEREEYEDRLIKLAIDSDVPIAFGVGANRQLDLLKRAEEQGARLIGLAHSRGISVMLSFQTRLPFDRLPTWRQVRAEPLERQRSLFVDPDTRRRLIEEANGGQYGGAVGAEARRPDYENMRVFLHPLPPNPTVAEVARSRGIDPVEAIIDLGLEADFDLFFAQPLSATGADEAVIREVMRDPRTVMTFSDSGAHVSQISDASIQTHLLGHWVRQLGDFSLEEAVQMITSAPAEAWGIPERGLLRPGFAADVNVFDPATVAPRMPALTYDLPGGARRIVQGAEGFKATVINGVLTFSDGDHTGAASGRLLRRAPIQ
jgi:N-acyl-D-aspartate/D-glutamate deacylase